MSLLVQKYGGSSLSEASQIRNIAKSIHDLNKNGHKMIVVVSAMGDTTDNLMGLAKNISEHPPRRELDMLLSAGERISMALMSMCLNDLGSSAISFTGSQAGIFTDGSHSDARITDLKPIRVEESLNEDKVVVLAGFQGVNPSTKEVTTLGRGGSDTTAVAMAHHFKAERCEILKDVDGVCTADPRVTNKSKPIPRLSYAQLSNMCFWGSKVLHYRAVELARKLSVPLFIGSSTNRDKGTLVTNAFQNPDYESSQVLSINSHQYVQPLSIMAKSMKSAVDQIENFAQNHDLPLPQILMSEQDGESFRFLITNDKNTLQSTVKQLKDSTFVKSLSTTLSSVTLTCYQSAHPKLVQNILDQLSSHRIEPEKMMNDAISVSLFVKPDQRAKCIEILHNLVI